MTEHEKTLRECEGWSSAARPDLAAAYRAGADALAALDAERALADELAAALTDEANVAHMPDAADRKMVALAKYAAARKDGT